MNNVIYSKTEVSLSQAETALANYGSPVYAFWLTCSQRLVIKT